MKKLLFIGALISIGSVNKLSAVSQEYQNECTKDFLKEIGDNPKKIENHLLVMALSYNVLINIIPAMALLYNFPETRSQKFFSWYTRCVVLTNIPILMLIAVGLIMRRNQFCKIKKEKYL